MQTKQLNKKIKITEIVKLDLNTKHNYKNTQKPNNKEK